MNNLRIKFTRYLMKKSKLIIINNTVPNDVFITGIIFVFTGRLEVTNPSKILLNNTSILLDNNKFITIETKNQLDIKDYIVNQYKISSDNIIHIRRVFQKNKVSINIVLLTKKLSLPKLKWINHLDFYKIQEYNIDEEYDLYEHIKFHNGPIINNHLNKIIESSVFDISLKIKTIYNSLIGDINVLFKKQIEIKSI